MTKLVAVSSQAIAFGDLSVGAFDISIKPLLDVVREEKEIAGYQQFVDYRRIEVGDNKIALEH